MTLIPFGQDWAAKVWTSIQIWLLVSPLTFLLQGLRLKGCGRHMIRTDWNHVKSDLLVWLLWFLLDTFKLPKLKKEFTSGWFKSLEKWPPGLVALIPVGRDWAAKVWKSIQIWLLVSPLSFLLEGLRLKGCGRHTIRTDSNHVKSDLLVGLLWFLFDTFKLPKLKKNSLLADSNHFNNDLLVWWLWFLLDRIGLPKFEKVFKSGCWCLRFHSKMKGCGWRVAGAIGSEPIQTMSNLIFWFGDFRSFWARLGCQSLKKNSILADSNHFNSDLLVWWLWFLLVRIGPPKFEKVFKSGCWCLRFHSFLNGCHESVANDELKSQWVTYLYTRDIFCSKMVKMSLFPYFWPICFFLKKGDYSKGDYSRVGDPICENNEIAFVFCFRFGKRQQNWESIDLIHVTLFVAQISGKNVSCTPRKVEGDLKWFWWGECYMCMSFFEKRKSKSKSRWRGLRSLSASCFHSMKTWLIWFSKHNLLHDSKHFVS